MVSADDDSTHRWEEIATSQIHRFKIKAQLSLSFELASSSDTDTEFPKFTLESTDGAYVETKSSRDDLIPGDLWLQICFERLSYSKSYRLTREDWNGSKEVLFDDLPCRVIMDQPREETKAYFDQYYGLFELFEADEP